MSMRLQIQVLFKLVLLIFFFLQIKKIIYLSAVSIEHLFVPQRSASVQLLCNSLSILYSFKPWSVVLRRRNWQAMPESVHIVFDFGIG